VDASAKRARSFCGFRIHGFIASRCRARREREFSAAGEGGRRGRYGSRGRPPQKLSRRHSTRRVRSELLFCRRCCSCSVVAVVPAAQGHALVALVPPGGGGPTMMVSLRCHPTMRSFLPGRVTLTLPSSFRPRRSRVHRLWRLLASGRAAPVWCPCRLRPRCVRIVARGIVLRATSLFRGFARLETDKHLGESLLFRERTARRIDSLKRLGRHTPDA